MRLNAQCLCCLVRRQEKNIVEFTDEDKKLEYMQKVLRRLSEAGGEDCAPSLNREMKELFRECWGVPERDFTEINREYNELVLGMLPEIRAAVRASEDPLEAALRYARMGNYIDFSAIPNLEREKFLELLNGGGEPLDKVEYANFCRDLSAAKSLLYIMDNCGEIVLDRLVIELLLEMYPELAITVIVRGAPTDNDATMTDAEMCGLTKLVRVIGNGSNVSGTWLSGVNSETRELLHAADVVIAKGQGNYETLHDCGENIYYLFLCKCDWFLRLFDVKPLTGMFVNERRVKDNR